MKYLLFKYIYKKIWKEAAIGDAKLHAKETLPLDVIKESSSFYSAYSKKNLEFNLYYDTTKEVRPLIIHIHGGGWAYGNKDMDDNFAYHLTKYNFNVSTISYTLAFKAKLINQLHEIDDYLNYLYANKDKYYLDMNNIFMVGDSAGGELIFLYNAIINNEDLYDTYHLSKKDYNKNIKAICLNHATCYIKDLGRIPNEKYFSEVCMDGIKRTLLGKNYIKSNLYNKCEPQEVLKEDSTISPILILTSKGDKSFSYQSKLLDNDLNKLNIEHEFVDLDNEKAIHVFNVLYPDLDDSIDFNNKMTSFFSKYITKD